MSYSHKVDRRTTLKWMMAGLASTSVAAACGQPQVPSPSQLKLGKPKPITGAPYGADPDMVEALVTWERTMTAKQHELVAVLSNIILPATDELPPATAVGVPDFIDEWVSSPYEQTQNDRTSCFDLFEWLEGESMSTHNVSFASVTEDQQKAILDRIAWRDRVEAGLEDQANAFGTFRYLAASAYFASEEGAYWIGYRGNIPSMGDYAGPTDEALVHLQAALEPLGLIMPDGL